MGTANLLQFQIKDQTKFLKPSKAADLEKFLKNYPTAIKTAQTFHEEEKRIRKKSEATVEHKGILGLRSKFFGIL